jgi:hypothetical protein
VSDRRAALAVVLACCFTALPSAQDDVLARIRQEGMERSKVQEVFSFRAAGVPGFNPIQEYKDYDVRMHHTNVDTYERVREQDLKQNAIVMAWFAWQAATTTDRIPRP